MDSSWTVITENTLHRIQHYCNPLQNVHRKLNIENHDEAHYVLFT